MPTVSRSCWGLAPRADEIPSPCARGDPSHARRTATLDVAVLIERLLETGHRLQELTAGEIDSVADVAGRTSLLPQAQADLRRRDELSDARYRGLLEAAPDAMVVVDEAGAIVLVNVRAEKQFGYSRDELLGQPVTNITPDGFAERLIADDLRSVEDARAQVIGTGIELVARRRDGSQFPIEIMLSPLDSPDGVLVTAAIRDIAARRASELEVTHTAAKLAESGHLCCSADSRPRPGSPPRREMEKLTAT